MSVSPDNILATTAERIFALAETELHLRQDDHEPNQVWWHFDGNKINLTRLEEMGYWTLETICTDEELTSKTVYVFNDDSIVTALTAHAPRREATASNNFVFNAIEDPFNLGPVDEADQSTFIRMLVSGICSSDV